MHIVAFNGSPRNKGNTHKMLARILERCEENGFTTELIHMGSDPHACKDCGLCQWHDSVLSTIWRLADACYERIY